MVLINWLLPLHCPVINDTCIDVSVDWTLCVYLHFLSSGLLIQNVRQSIWQWERSQPSYLPPFYKVIHADSISKKNLFIFDLSGKNLQLSRTESWRRSSLQKRKQKKEPKTLRYFLNFLSSSQNPSSSKLT